jgi:hypothetical protein
LVFAGRSQPADEPLGGMVRQIRDGRRTFEPSLWTFGLWPRGPRTDRGLLMLSALERRGSAVTRSASIRVGPNTPGLLGRSRSRWIAFSALPAAGVAGG